LFARASLSVERAGEQRQACWNATRSAGVADLCACNAMAGVGPGLGGSVVGVVVGCKVVVQSGLSLLRVPVRMSSPLSQTSAVVEVKITLHPSSQSWPMEMRLVLPREGNKWAFLAAVESCLTGIRAWCVDCMVLPSGKVTWMPLAVGTLSVYVASYDRKWPVAPESKKDWVVGGEGPSGCG
jgi:hypothetical protein